MQYLYRRGAVYHFYRRVPQSLVPHYGKVHIRHSLHTKDIYEAKRRRNLILVQQDQEFSALLSANAFPADQPLSPYSARNADITANVSTIVASRVHTQADHLDDAEYPLIYQAEARELDGHDFAETFQIPARIQSNQHKATTLSQLIDEHRREHTNKLAKPATVAEYESVYALLLSILSPHTILTDIDRQQARKVKNVLEHLTPNYSKRKETKGHPPATVADIVKANKDLPLPKPATANKKLCFINALFNYALDEEWIQTNPFRRLSVKDTQRAKDKRQPFTEAELKLLVGRLQVDSLSGQGCALDYWATLVALHQGMRMGEILQLKKRDISQVRGIWTIRIHNDDIDNTVKTNASCRTVPVHQKLIDRGLLTLTQGRDPESLLLTGVQRASDGTYSSWYTKTYSRLLKRVGIHSPYKKTFHSFRHNFRDACRDAEIPAEVIDRLGGWTTEGVSAAYGQGASMATLKKFIDRVRYHW